MIERVVTTLRGVADRVHETHDRVWWPDAGVTMRSRVGGVTRTASPMLVVGDEPSMARWHDFVTDLNLLRSEVNQLCDMPPPTVKLDVRTHPTRVMLSVVAVVRYLLRWGADVDGDDLRVVEGRSERLSGHQEAILSRPRVSPSPPCKNAGERDLCTGWATNRTRGLCRSCENHEQYLRTRKRTRR
jgi:hypothetical protein